MIRSFEQRAEQKISGFQSPASDYLEGRLDVAKKLVIDPHCTFYFQMEGDGMVSYGIHSGDLLIIDRSIKPDFGAIVIAFVTGSFCCRMFQEKNGKPVLLGDGDCLENTDGEVLQIWGVVSCLCRNMLPETLRKGRYSHVCAL